MEKMLFVVSILNLIAALILAFITGWYARSTANMLKEMREQSRLIALSASASVEAAIMQLPPPGTVSTAHSNSFSILQHLRGKLMKQADFIWGPEE